MWNYPFTLHVRLNAGCKIGCQHRYPNWRTCGQSTHWWFCASSKRIFLSKKIDENSFLKTLLSKTTKSFPAKIFFFKLSFSQKVEIFKSKEKYYFYKMCKLFRENLFFPKKIEKKNAKSWILIGQECIDPFGNLIN